MKKLVCLLAVLAFTAPVLADPCNVITITAEDAGSGQLRVSYNVDPCSPDAPVGIGLKFECSGDGTADASSVVSYDPCFPVHIDYAHDQIPGGWDPCDYDPCNPPYEIGDPCQTPIADPCGAGVLPGAQGSFSLCLGKVDPCGIIPTGETRELALIQLSGTGSTQVTITEDDLRGGIVGSTFEVILPPDPITVVLAGEPTCWDATECGGQPLGDFTCDGAVDLADLGAIRNAWGTDKDIHAHGKNPGEYNCCSDSNHDGKVDLADLGDIRTGWGTSGYTPATGNQNCPPGYD